MQCVEDYGRMALTEDQEPVPKRRRRATRQHCKGVVSQDSQGVESAILSCLEWKGSLPIITVPWPMGQLIVLKRLEIYMPPIVEASGLKRLPADT